MSFHQLARDLGYSAPLHLELIGANGQVTPTELHEPFAILGRWQGCHQQLDHPTVSKRHAIFLVSERRAYFFDLGSRFGLSVNGIRSERGWLLPGETLKIGALGVRLSAATVLDTTAPSDPDLSLMTGENRLVLQRTDQRARDSSVYPLVAPITVIGRHPGCDFRVADPRVNLFHAAIIPTITGAWLVDLFMGNIRLNGVRVGSSSLYTGDVIDLNGVTVEVRFQRATGQLPFGTDGGQSRPAYLPSTELATTLVPAGINASEFGELRDQMRMLASLFVSMQQEQIEVMKMQTEVLREVAAAFREGRLPAAADQSQPALPVSPPPLASPLPIPRPPQPGDTEAFAKAHEWLMSRFGSLGPKDGKK